MCRLIFMSSKVKMPGIIGIHPFIIESTITAQNTPVNLNEESECNKHLILVFRSVEQPKTTRNTQA